MSVSQSASNTKAVGAWKKNRAIPQRTPCVKRLTQNCLCGSSKSESPPTLRVLQNLLNAYSLSRCPDSSCIKAARIPLTSPHRFHHAFAIFPLSQTAL